MCIFCDIIANKIPRRTVYEDDQVVAILDISPLSYGHTLVMPKQHVTDFLDADRELVASVVKVTQDLSKHIMAATNADGLNIVSNCKEAAGQSVDHLHFHIIPRYTGDNAISFTPLKEVPDLDEVLKKIKV